MTWIVQWNDKDYDVDPTLFTGRELSEIKKRAGFTFKELLAGLGQLDGDAFRCLFWTVERRDNPSLNFGDYDGPPVRLLITNLPGFNQVAEDLGKALDMEKVDRELQTLTTEMLGSPPSPKFSPPSETGTSTTG